MKYLFITAGTFSLAMGVAGIFLPGLPTTPFVLLAAGLFVRSSEKLYNMLINSNIFGKYIKEYRENPGMTIKTKISAIGLMWAMTSISVYSIESNFVRIIILLAALAGTIVMGFIVKTINK